MSLPLFPTTTVGSLPRTPSLLAALRERRRGALSRAEFDRVADAEVLACLALQERAGVDLVSDGEQRRDNFYSFVAEKLSGVRLLSLADMLEVVEDKASFEAILQTLDVPAYSIFNPTCHGPVRRLDALAADEARFLRRHTDRPIKVPLPGPYLLTRALWVPEVARQAYASKEALGDDVVAVLRAELEDLRREGVAFVQFDEPVLTELVFGQGQTRTFMCAHLAARADPAEELAWAVDLLNRVVADFDDLRLGVHVCRGNWSRDETTLLSGAYVPLVPTFEAFHVRQLVLEYATPRAGAVLPVPGKELGLGVVNPRTAEIETADTIRRRLEAACTAFAPERLFVNPDCGFGTFSSRPMNDRATAEAKLKAMTRAARELR